jgi:HTH-type transcriptional regulator, competence development regulator
MSDGPYPNHLGQFMRAAGLTDPGLGKAIGVSKQQIFNLRRGHRKLTVEWAKRVAPHLKVSWQELITGSAPKTPDPARADLLAVIDAMSDTQCQALLAWLKTMAPDDQPAPPPRSKGPGPPSDPFQVGGRVRENRVSRPLLKVAPLPPPCPTVGA